MGIAADAAPRRTLTCLSSTFRWTTLPAVALAALAMVAAASLGAQEPIPTPTPAATQQSVVGVRNPRELHAVLTLERREPGDSAHVRFEWDPVAGAQQYVLSGHWTSPPSWTMHTREYRVTSRNAAAWTSRRVTFEAEIPEGNHSWSVVALFASTSQSGGKVVADYANPTTLSFDVR